MLKKLFSWAFQSEETAEVSPNSSGSATFRITLNNEILGYLRTDEEGGWKFEYSDSFTNQSKFLPLVDFPNKTKSYQSEDLWPFFLSRIPGLKQPGIQKILKENHLSETDTVALLKRFGRQSIQNPYLLEPVN
jgi:HipA-like protein